MVAEFKYKYLKEDFLQGEQFYKMLIGCVEIYYREIEKRETEDGRKKGKQKT